MDVFRILNYVNYDIDWLIVYEKYNDTIQLRYLQTLNNIAAENNSTIVFPVPMDMFRNMFGGEINSEDDPTMALPSDSEM